METISGMYVWNLQYVTIITKEKCISFCSWVFFLHTQKKTRAYESTFNDINSAIIPSHSHSHICKMKQSAWSTLDVKPGDKFPSSFLTKYNFCFRLFFIAFMWKLLLHALELVLEQQKQRRSEIKICNFSTSNQFSFLFLPNTKRKKHWRISEWKI